MNKSEFEDTAWQRAMTLAERADSVCTNGREGPVHREHESRSQRWPSQPPFSNSTIFVKRLVAEGLNEDQFLAILSEPLDSLRSRFPSRPPWVAEIAEAFCEKPCSGGIIPESLAEDPALGFVHFIEPLIARSVAQLRAAVQSILCENGRAPFQLESIEKLFLPDLLHRSAIVLSRTMVLELNVARIEGNLDGATPEDRFRSFLHRIRQSEIRLSILHEYPVLARQLTLILGQWVAFVREFVQRLASDWNLIRSTFSRDADPGILEEVHSDGDRHRNGRSVLIAKFTSGFRLVYKPKSMAIDAHFQELLAWINEKREDHPSFQTLRLLNRGAYGWSEFIAHQTCDSIPALRRFYERQGAYLALLHMLHATDFHSDNLIAAGEHPVLIDLEALFHPVLPELGDSEPEFVNSVLSVGLLPWRDSPTVESAGIDISGFGGTAGQMTPQAVPDWDRVGTDEMRLVRKRVQMPGSHNRPSLNGTDVNLRDYREEILTGFRKIYALVLKHRDELLSPDGPLQRFANDEVRVIFRGTNSYGVLLAESFHPDVLRNALDREMLFDRLWLTVQSRPYMARLIVAERGDLQKGDVPLFASQPGRKDVWTSSMACIKDVFEEPTLEFVRRRIQQMGPRDVDLQLWMIRASLATTAVGHARSQRSSAWKVDDDVAVDRDQLLKAARSIGDRIESGAIRHNGTTSWVGLALADESHWMVSPLGADLYDGLPGIALFLAYLENQTGEFRYKDLAREACNAALKHSEKNKSWIRLVGAFEGWGGIVYMLTHLGVLWHEPALLDKAAEYVPTLLPLIEKDEHFDLLAGCAGCIGGLLVLHDRMASPDILTAAVRCGDHLLAHARQTENGIGWIIPQEVKALSGFAHGTAGIAWALLKLAAVTGEERFRTAAVSAINYERTLFCPEAGNWRDLRVPLSAEAELNEPFMVAWCNGAVGIGLARLSTINNFEDDQVQGEIEAALATTLREGFGLNHSLCHGDFGNLELLLLADRAFRGTRWRSDALRIAGNSLNSALQNGYLCGTPSNVDSPGLMTGLAGIGYGLLRLAEPERMPSLLTLEPPLQN